MLKLQHLALFLGVLVLSASFASMAYAQNCRSGQVPCGNGCMPSSGNCCAHLGYQGYCESGTTCTNDGGCERPCASGQVRCGDGCMPRGADCCAPQGYDTYCDGGAMCTATGGCSSGGGGSGGGGTCATGQERCGDGCMPLGAECCVSFGHDIYCSRGVCTTDGNCRTSGGSSGGGSSGGDNYSCASSEAGQCSAEFCVDSSACRAYYTVNGRRFTCLSCSDLTRCAERAADSCESNSDDGGGGVYSDVGCRSLGRGTTSLLLLLASILFWRRKR